MLRGDTYREKLHCQLELAGRIFGEFRDALCEALGRGYKFALLNQAPEDPFSRPFAVPLN